MNIAMVTGDYLPSIGGIASHIAEISQALARQGHRVEVWQHDAAARPATSLPDVPTIRLEPAEPRRWPRSLKLAPRLAALILDRARTFQPDILHCHTLEMALAMRFVGPHSQFRRILTNHSSGYLALVKSWHGRLRVRLLYSRVDGVLAPSEELLAQSRHLGVPPNRLQYIPNGVDPEKFTPGDKAAARRALDLPADRPILLATRRFAVKNGLRYLALALDEVRRALPDVLCVFCGNATDTEELPAVEQIIRERRLADNVRLEGAIPNQRIAAYLHACDVVVLPSLVEATSISGLEAMSAAKPLVGTRVGGIPALIDDGRTGRLVPPRDSAALAAGLVDVLRGAHADQMGAAARRRVLECFSWDTIARHTTEFYARIRELSPR